MKIIIKPIPKTIVKIEPHQSKVPAVVNDASPDFSESVLKAFRKREDARIKNTKAITNPAKKLINPAPKPIVGKAMLVNVNSEAKAIPITIAAIATAIAISAIM